MNRKQIGIGIMIVALFALGVGIGLKSGNPEMDNNYFTIAGLILNVIGLLILISANKKADK